MDRNDSPNRRAASCLAAIAFFLIFGIMLISHVSIMPDLMTIIQGNGAGIALISALSVIFILGIAILKFPVFIAVSEILWGGGIFVFSYSRYESPPFNASLFLSGIILIILGLKDFKKLSDDEI